MTCPNGVQGCIHLPGFVVACEAGYTYRQSLQSVGHGWRSLIRVLWQAKPADVRVEQVKEKYGELRFYVGPAPLEYLELIDHVTELSRTICEWCGALGKRESFHGWLYTLCHECKRRREESYRGKSDDTDNN